MSIPPRPWRVGRKLGRTVYRGDELIGLMDRAEDANLIVRLVNAEPAIVAALEAAERYLERGHWQETITDGEVEARDLVRAALTAVREGK